MHAKYTVGKVKLMLQFIIGNNTGTERWYSEWKLCYSR